MKDLIEALTIFLKYGNPHNPSHCEHDYFFINISPSLVNDEDKKRLDDLEFFPDEEYGEDEGFGSFRFGSC